MFVAHYLMWIMVVTASGANLSKSSLSPRLLRMCVERDAGLVEDAGGEEEDASVVAAPGGREEGVSSAEVDVSLSATSSLVSIHEL